MRKAQAGDVQSYQTLLLRIRDLLGKYIANSFKRFRHCGIGGQEDVLQDILLAIHLKRHTYDPEQFFLPWMYAIARYKSVDFFRKNKLFLKSAVHLDEELENIESLMVFESSAELDLISLCETLPEKQKVVLRLTKIEGLSMQEVSVQTGYSVTDIKVTVHRAIKALQDKAREGAI
ncbi:ECF RNA polymerase sigma factor SigD [compost metagenome]